LPIADRAIHSAIADCHIHRFGIAALRQSECHIPQIPQSPNESSICHWQSAMDSRIR
jgi:hypothetical protein